MISEKQLIVRPTRLFREMLWVKSDYGCIQLSNSHYSFAVCLHHRTSQYACEGDVYFKQHSTNKLINKYLFVFFSYNTGLKINQILVNYNNNKHNNSLNAFEKRGLEHRSANRRYFQYNLWKNLCENIVVV